MRPASEYPAALVVAAEQAPPGPWLYTGGLENHPEVLTAISAERELLGNAPAAIRTVRDPLAWSERCHAAGLATLATRSGNEPPSSGAWMSKPLRSAGGSRVMRQDAPPYSQADTEHYWQAFAAGEPQSAVYLAFENGVALLGVTEQLVGTPWAGSRRFQYAGSIGPLSLSAALVRQYAALGDVLGSGLRGLFGVDTIVSAEGELFPVEINPRYTASVEVLERALGYCALGWHVAACRKQLTSCPYEFPAEVACETAVGKVILFAQEPSVIDDDFTAACLAENAKGDWPNFGDVPRGGTVIEAGEPVLTLFATGKCTESVRQNLKRGAAALS